jgi:Ca2+-transporting ATPase
MQILWINIIMDGPPAQSLGVEPVTADVMKSPPRDPKTPAITKQMITKIAIGSVIMLVGTLSMFFNALEETSTEDGENRRATTIAFTTFVMFQMFNALNCR